MKAIRYLGIGVAGFVGLILLGAGIVALVFDPNQYKPDLIRMVHEKTGRILAIDGTIELTLFPHLGAAVDRLALSGPGGEGKFASVGQAKITMALLPLLTRRVVADHLDLSDLSVDLVKHGDGTTNFDDLAGGDETQAPAKSPRPLTDPVKSLALDIGGIRVRQANIVWRDEASGRSVSLSSLDATMDGTAEGARGQLELATHVEASKPDVKAQIKGSARYRLDLAKGAFAFDDLDLRMTSDVPGAAGLVATVRGDIEVDPEGELVDIARLAVVATSTDGLDLKASVPKLRLGPSGAAGEAASAELKIVRSAGTLTARLDLSPLLAEGRQVRFDKVVLDAAVSKGGTSLVARLASPLDIDFDAHTVELPSLAGDLVASGPQLPRKSAKGSLRGRAGVAWGRPSSVSAELAGQIEDSNLRLKIVVADLRQPAIRFDVIADQLDLEQYLPAVPSQRRTAPVVRDGAATAPVGELAVVPDKTLGLSGLKNLNANGSVRIATLTARQIKAQNVHLGVRAAGGKMEISPLAANLYQGALAGSASVNTNSKQFAIDAQLTGVALGALLRDAAGFATLDGRGNVVLELTTTGTTITAAKRALAGSVRIDVRDGVLKGVNLGEIISGAGSLFGAKSTVAGRTKATDDQTEFSQLSGSFAIRGGVAQNDDLLGQSPLLKVTGTGTIDLGNERIDYLLKTTPVGAIPIGGKRTLSVLRGVAIPIRIAGPLAAPEYSVDLAQLAVEAAKTGVKLSIGTAVGVPEAAVPIFKDWLHGLRGKR